MDKELRERMRTAILDAWNDKGKDQTFGKFLDDSADAIDALYQAHYAEKAEKEGLRPDNPYDKPIHSDNSIFILKVIEAKDGFDKGVAATLAKVMPWHEAKVEVAVKETQKSIANVLMNSIALEFKMEPDIVTIRLPIKYIESLKGGK